MARSRKRQANASSSSSTNTPPAVTPNTASNQVTTPSCSRRLPIPITPASTPLSSTCSSPASPIIATQPSVQQVNETDNAPNESLESFIKEQRELNKRLMALISEKESSRAQKRGPLPLQLTEDVRTVYKNMDTAVKNGEEIELWDFQKSFSAQENETVNTAIMRGVLNTATYPAGQVRVAVRTHFKTKRRRWSLDKTKAERYLKSQRRRSRINTKRAGRLSSLNESTTIQEEEKKKIKAVLENQYMSSDDSVEESEGEHSSSDSSDDDQQVTKRKTRCFKRRRLTWRSQELDNIFKKLDKRVKRRRTAKGNAMVMERREGQPSRRERPVDAPAWAISIV